MSQFYGFVERHTVDSPDFSGKRQKPHSWISFETTDATPRRREKYHTVVAPFGTTGVYYSNSMWNAAQCFYSRIGILPDAWGDAYDQVLQAHRGRGEQHCWRRVENLFNNRAKAIEARFTRKHRAIWEPMHFPQGVYKEWATSFPRHRQRLYIKAAKASLQNLTPELSEKLPLRLHVKGEVMPQGKKPRPIQAFNPDYMEHALIAGPYCQEGGHRLHEEFGAGGDLVAMGGCNYDDVQATLEEGRKSLFNTKVGLLKVAHATGRLEDFAQLSELQHAKLNNPKAYREVIVDLATEMEMDAVLDITRGEADFLEADISKMDTSLPAELLKQIRGRYRSWGMPHATSDFLKLISKPKGYWRSGAEFFCYGAPNGNASGSNDTYWVNTWINMMLWDYALDEVCRALRISRENCACTIMISGDDVLAITPKGWTPLLRAHLPDVGIKFTFNVKEGIHLTSFLGCRFLPCAEAPCEWTPVPLFTRVLFKQGATFRQKKDLKVHALEWAAGLYIAGAHCPVLNYYLTRVLRKGGLFKTFSLQLGNPYKLQVQRKQRTSGYAVAATLDRYGFNPCFHRWQDGSEIQNSCLVQDEVSEQRGEDDILYLSFGSD